ncbi:MAG: tryptophan synthase subunit alpha [Actinobacteria bacterium]|uniref:tryptophan synthase n=1 Tax=freshwater metagenome TaxID=449393 RepID=A0A6J6HQ19_9ZZZZ|nr:tryptophan synthase subunit alpha [Actinomycetota bacterium]
MSKVEAAFAANKAAGKDTLIGYFPLGFPTLSESVEAAVAMAEGGVDILELGVPYSDPVMDGPVIQEATELSLANGFKLRQTFDAVKEVSERTGVPVLVMTYWNPVMQFGVQKFAEALKQAGGAGMITPDLIPDEAAEWLAAADQYDLDRVFLAAPTSSAERIQNAAELSRGFVYAVSTMGITGARDEVDSLARGVVSAVRDTDVQANVAVGIGISTGEQASAVNDYADGAIIGSVFVRAYSQGGLPELKRIVAEIESKMNKGRK